MIRSICFTLVCSTLSITAFADTNQPPLVSACRPNAHTIDMLICSSTKLQSLEAETTKVEVGLFVKWGDWASKLEKPGDWYGRRAARCDLPLDGSIDPAAATIGVACLERLYGDRLAALAQDPGPPPMSHDDSAHAQQACQQFGELVRNIDFKDDDVLAAVSQQSKGLVKFDTSSETIGQGEEAMAKLRKLLHLSKNSSEAWEDEVVAQNDTTALRRKHHTASLPDSDPGIPEDEQTTVRRLGGGSTVIAAETVAGSAYCQSFWFYDLKGVGPGTPISAPETGSDANYCGSTHASLGEVGGIPTFGIETNAGDSSGIRLISRRDEIWRSYCKVQVTWQPLFEVTDQFCSRPTCPAVPDGIPKTVAAFHSSNRPNQLWSDAKLLTTPNEHQMGFQEFFRAHASKDYRWAKSDINLVLREAMYRTVEIDGTPTTIVSIERNEETAWYAVWIKGESIRVVDFANRNSSDQAQPYSELPTFGATLLYYTEFGSDAAVAPIRVGNRTLLMQIGHGHRGWRGSDDYLVGLFSPGAEGLEPVAGLAIANRRAPGPQVTVD